jgi:hypothetical protein
MDFHFVQRIGGKVAFPQCIIVHTVEDSLDITPFFAGKVVFPHNAVAFLFKHQFVNGSNLLVTQQ